jgi:nickel-dependent lactate racemase
VLDNPSRAETDAVGAMVGIDFLINVVVTANSEPVKAFCGETMPVHHAGVEYGDWEVWGVEVGEGADVVVVSPGSGPVPEPYNLESLYRAARVTRPDGFLIALTAQATEMEAIDGDTFADESLLALDADEFVKALPTLDFSEIVRLHEARNWPLDERTIQWRLKSVRGEFYRRRKAGEVRSRNPVLAPDVQAALDRALGTLGKDARVMFLPEGRLTLPKQRLFKA